MSNPRLARNLLAAFLANRLGISIGYALKAHVPEQPGDYWLRLAEVVEREISDDLAEKFTGVRQESVQ